MTDLWAGLAWLLSGSWHACACCGPADPGCRDRHVRAHGGVERRRKRAKPPSSTAAPGWLARRRPRAGIGHGRSSWGVGYRSALGGVRLSDREFADHGVLFGAPGSGKTTALQLLIEAAAGRLAVVIVDPKGSQRSLSTSQRTRGTAWTIDGTLPADLLESRPWQVRDLLLESEDYSPEARAFRDAAHQRALGAAWALALRGEPMHLGRLRTLLERSALIAALEPFQQPDERIGRWLNQLRRRDAVDDAGARDLDRALGSLLDRPALRGSLNGGPEALRLDDVLETRGLVLFSLDVADYPHASRKVAWLLLAIGRLAGALPATGGHTRALLLVDEVSALGSSARHLRGLAGRAREAGLSVVLANEGPERPGGYRSSGAAPGPAGHGLATCIPTALARGRRAHAGAIRQALGRGRGLERPRVLDHAHVERPNVSVGEWMNAMQPGDTWLRVAPVDGRRRQHRIRVAMPRKLGSENAHGNVLGQEGRSVRDDSVSEGDHQERPQRRPAASRP
jgi:hypothetical protein